MSSNTKPRILLCEDDPNLGLVLKNFLELNDYEVILERDGRLGLAAFQHDAVSAAVQCPSSHFPPFFRIIVLARLLGRVRRTPPPLTTSACRW